MKIDFYPQKAQYITNEKIVLLATLEGTLCPVKAELTITFLYKKVHSQSILLQNGINEIQLDGYESSFQGYGAQLIVENGKEDLIIQTAFDVVSSPDKSIRYGFLSDFTTQDNKDHKDIENLRKFHINMVQFYDWSYRHDDLVANSQHYKDMMGKEIDLNTVKNKIKKLNQLGMKALAYGAIYAASGEFFQLHPDWAFYNSADKPFQFIDIFYIMNIEKDSPWRRHIIEQYVKAVKEVGFQGIHMDTYGFPKTAYSKLGGEHKLIKLDKEFASMINDTKDAMIPLKTENYLIFNNVGNWPVTPVGTANQSAIYIEVWDPYNHYFQIKQIILAAQSAGKYKKPVILAAYLAPFRLETQRKASYAAYILTAVIVTNGAYHLLLGEENGVLTQGYYVDHSFLDSGNAVKMRSYYDFMIRYMNLFYDATMKDVTMTHIGWDNYEYQCHYDNCSFVGEPDKVWLTLRENDQFKCISLINLCGCSDDLWNKGKEEPQRQNNIAFTVHVDTDVKNIFYATADDGDTRSYPIAFSYAYTDKGKFVEFSLASLTVWSIIYIEMDTVL